MATLTVSTTADIVNPDDGVLSLREAVNLANATTTADIIGFDSAVKGNTLVLTGGELVLSSDVTIHGGGVTLDAAHSSRLLNIGRDVDVNLDNLTLTDGRVEEGGNPENGGGGIHLGSSSSLSMNGSTIRDCGSSGDGGCGGGIYADAGSKLTLTGCTIIRNYTGDNGFGDNAAGAGIFTRENVELKIYNSLISDNLAPEDGGGICVTDFENGSTLMLVDSVISGNLARLEGVGGGISLIGCTATILRSAILDNFADYWGGGISVRSSTITISDSTIANNASYYISAGGGLFLTDDSAAVVRNSTITGNRADYGGGISSPRGTLDIANSIVAGNSTYSGSATSDIYGQITVSDGHNIFGSDVGANPAGDRENIAASAIFAAIDPDTGGGLLNASGVVPLRNSLDNPALSGGDLLAAGTADQLGTARPLPAGSLPDIGAAENNRAPSTTATPNNDLLTGNASDNSLSGLGGNDYLKGLGGKDNLSGGASSDLLDGGAANDTLNGGSGTDFALFGGSTAVVVDLSLTNDTAKRGGETDKLVSIEGAIGSSANDTFKGDNNANWFQGGLGKDTATGGGGRDLYDFNAVADSKAGATTRDVITDFGHLVDKLDLMGLDADTTVAGNQAFRWVGTAALTGPGEVGYFTSGGNTIVRASNDADLATEFEIQLTGIKTLTAVDFYL